MGYTPMLQYKGVCVDPAPFESAAATIDTKQNDE